MSALNKGGDTIDKSVVSSEYWMSKRLSIFDTGNVIIMLNTLSQVIGRVCVTAIPLLIFLTTNHLT